MEEIPETRFQIPIGLKWLGMVITMSNLADSEVHEFAESFIESTNKDGKGSARQMLASHTVDEIRSSVIGSCIRHAFDDLREDQEAFLVELQIVGIAPIKTLQCKTIPTNIKRNKG